MSGEYNHPRASWKPTSHQLQSSRHPYTCTGVSESSCATMGYESSGPAYRSADVVVIAFCAQAPAHKVSKTAPVPRRGRILCPIDTSGEKLQLKRSLGQGVPHQHLERDRTEVRDYWRNSSQAPRVCC